MKPHFLIFASFQIIFSIKVWNTIDDRYSNFVFYEGQSEITESYLIIFKSSKIDSFLDDISLKLYVIYSIT